MRVFVVPSVSLLNVTDRWLNAAFLFAVCWHADCLLHNTALSVDSFRQIFRHRVHSYINERSAAAECRHIESASLLRTCRYFLFTINQRDSLWNRFQTNTHTQHTRGPGHMRLRPRPRKRRDATLDVRQIPSRGRAAATSMWSLMAGIFDDWLISRAMQAGWPRKSKRWQFCAVVQHSRRCDDDAQCVITWAENVEGSCHRKADKLSLAAAKTYLAESSSWVGPTPPKARQVSASASQCLHPTLVGCHGDEESACAH